MSEAIGWRAADGWRSRRGSTRAEPRRALVVGLTAVLLPFVLATAAHAQPDISVVRMVDFGMHEASEKATEVLRVTNQGNANLTILATGAGPNPPFSMQNFGVFNIPPGQFWDGPVMFQSNAEGQFNGQATIQTNDPNEPVVTIQLRGQVSPKEEPNIEVENRVRFGRVPIGSSASVEVVIANSGTATLRVGNIETDRSEFAADLGGFNVRPGRSRSVIVTVRLTDAGRHEGELRISSNDPDQPLVTVRLIAIGESNVPDIDVQPPRIDFGELPERGTATSGVLISNLGNATLDVGSISAGFPFGVAAMGGFKLEPGQSRSVEVSFTPPGAGNFAGRLAISSNDPDQPTFVVDLVGSGVARPIAFEVQVLPGNVRLVPGSSANVRYRIREVAGNRIDIRIGSVEVQLADGRRLDFQPRALQQRLDASGTLEIDDTVRLPVEAAGGEALWVITFVGSDGTNEFEAQVVVRMIPTGSFGSDFAVTTVAILQPMAGTTVAPGDALRARALVVGSGSGSAIGTWFVDGVPVETFTVDLTGGRPAEVVTILSLPTTILGPRVVTVEIEEPNRFLSEEVRYYVTTAGDPMRWVLPPGRRSFVADGVLPAWDWTPKAGALGYEVFIDGTLDVRVERPRYSMTELARSGLLAGAPSAHRVGVRAIFASRSEARLLVEETLEAGFRLIKESDPIELVCDEDRCFWPKLPGDIFNLVVEDPDGSTVFRKLTAAGEIVLAEFRRLLPGDRLLRMRVEAFNQNKEVVGVSGLVSVVEPPGGLD